MGRSRGLRPTGIAIVFILIFMIIPPLAVNAQCPANLVLAITSGPNLLVDSNKPGIEGPMVATVSAVISNTGAGSANNVYIYIGDGTTPGTFPVGGDSNSLVLIGGVDDATRFIGDLLPGQTKTIYWQITYPFTYNMPYLFSVWASSNAGNCSATANQIVTTRSSITANSNKLLGTISIEPASGIINPGNMLIVRVSGYNFGQVGSGPNGEEDAWFQPVGNLGFNPACFRLVKTEVLINSIQSTPFVDQVYFPGIGSQKPPPDYSSDSNDYVKYYFIALTDCSTSINPYMEVASGTQEKYSGDYEVQATTIPLVSEQGGLNFYKSADPTIAAETDVITWTITYGNNTAYPIGNPESGNGLVIIDEGIPENTTYVTGSATCSNDCTIFYSIDNGLTWLSTEPSPALVTQIKWHINEVIPANTDPAGNVSFQTSVNAGVSSDTTICNTASAHIDNGETLIADSACVNAGAPVIEASKQDAIVIDNDNNSVASPGDVLEYSIVISNTGNQIAQNVVFTDTPDSNTSLVVGSVDISECQNCIVASGNDQGDTDVAVSIGELAPDDSVTVYFRVTIGTEGFTSVANQGLLNGSNFDEVATDDPDTPASDDPTVTPVTIAPPELAITKMGPENAVIESNITYTGTMVNNGGSTAYNIVLIDYLPDGVSFVSSSHNAVYDEIDNTVTWDLGSLPPGGSIPGWVTVAISDELSDNSIISNLFSTNWQDSQANNYGPAEATWDTTIHTHPQLTIEKTAPEQASPGENINYTITVENIGGSTANNVILTDTLPTGVTYVTANPAPSGTNGEITWNLGTINQSGSYIISVTVEIDSGVVNETTLVNDSSVTWEDEFTTSYGPVTDNASTTVYTRPHLTITKTGPEFDCAGSSITYTGILSNVGGSTAYNAVLTDILPQGIEFVSTSHTATYDEINNTVTWDLGDIPPGTSIPGWLTLSIPLATPDNTLLTNTFEVVWEDDELNEYGPVTAAWNTVVYGGQLNISKTGPARSCPDGTIEYTITLENVTGCEIIDVSLVDTLPLNLNYIDSSHNGIYSNGSVTWQLDNIPAYDSFEVTLTVEVDSAIPDNVNLVNTATVFWNYEGNQIQKSSTWETRICSSPLLTIDKNGPAIIQPGESFNYQIEICNAGGTSADNVVLLDSLPEGVNYLSSTPEGVYSNGQITWSVGTLTTGDCALYTVEVSVDESVPHNTLLENVSGVSWDNEIATPFGPLYDIAETRVVAVPELQIDKTGTPQAFHGDEITYTIEICNVTDYPAPDVVLTDILPIGLTYVSSNPSGTFDNGIITWNLGTIESRECVSVTITTSVDCDISPSSYIRNTASTVWRDMEENVYGPVTDTSWTSIESAFSLFKYSKPDIVEPGEIITYKIEWENLGTKTFTGVTLTEMYDNNVEFIEAAPAPDTGTHNQWTIGDLPPWSRGQITITVRVKDDVADKTVIRNHVHITSAEFCGNDAVAKSTVERVEEDVFVGGEVTGEDTLEVISGWLVILITTGLITFGGFLLFRLRYAKK